MTQSIYDDWTAHALDIPRPSKQTIRDSSGAVPVDRRLAFTGSPFFFLKCPWRSNVKADIGEPGRYTNAKVYDSNETAAGCGTRSTDVKLQSCCSIALIVPRSAEIDIHYPASGTADHGLRQAQGSACQLVRYTSIATRMKTRLHDFAMACAWKTSAGPQPREGPKAVCGDGCQGRTAPAAVHLSIVATETLAIARPWLTFRAQPKQARPRITSIQDHVPVSASPGPDHYILFDHHDPIALAQPSPAATSVSIFESCSPAR
ncbi:hypothetical protein BKA81DRAFT_57917 [Phyllosticta paracitricarpa]